MPGAGMCGGVHMPTLHDTHEDYGFDEYDVEDVEDDGLNFFRALILGVPISLALWILIFKIAGII
jgi:hypothetical protein